MTTKNLLRLKWGPETIDVYFACGDVICVPQGSDLQQFSQIVAILRKECQ